MKKRTNTSEVCRFGDIDLANDHLSEYLGRKPAASERSGVTFVPDESCEGDAVPSPEVPKVILERRIKAAKTLRERKALKAELDALLDSRRAIERTTHKIVDSVIAPKEDKDYIMTTKPERITHNECYFTAVDEYHVRCYNIGRENHAMRQVHVFLNLCARGYKLDAIISAIKSVCQSPQPLIQVV